MGNTVEEEEEEAPSPRQEPGLDVEEEEVPGLDVEGLEGVGLGAELRCRVSPSRLEELGTRVLTTIIHLILIVKLSKLYCFLEKKSMNSPLQTWRRPSLAGLHLAPPAQGVVTT